MSDVIYSRLPRRTVSLALTSGLACLGFAVFAQSELLVLQKSQHVRKVWETDIQRVAVGDPDILSAEPIASREVLLLGKGWGRTSLIIWLKDKTIREYPVVVQRDIRLLQNTLQRLHSNIEAEIAPDRDAVVLSGTVPDLSVSRAAESLAQSYLDAGENARNKNRPDVLVRVAEDDTLKAGATEPPVARVSAVPSKPSGAVLNLLRLEKFPPQVEEKLAVAMQSIGGERVKVRRIQKGVLPDDLKDVFVLEGDVPNQVALVRILMMASQLVTGKSAEPDDVRVLADESGALARSTQGTGQQQQNVQLGSGGAGQGLFGGGGGGGGGGGNNRLTNQVTRNLARAKVVEAASGRLLSFLQVRDIPQIRVNIRLYEVNRSKLRTYNPGLGVLTSSGTQTSLNPPLTARGLQGNQAQRTGGNGSNAVQSVLSFLGGTLANQTQFSSAHFAVDAALSYLEREGVARSLSSPSLTVLSGEQALFQVGGQIPIPQSFVTALTAAGGAPGGVFNSVVFEEFGVRLSIRPLVDENDAVTLDVLPQIITPNADLTASIRDSTGTNQLTTAFLTRGLRTSARLQDGQALLIGGLLSRETSDNRSSTPGVRDVPGLGWLFKDFNKADDGRELIIVVNPVVLRDPVPGVGLWAYPETSEMLPKRLTP